MSNDTTTAEAQARLRAHEVLGAAYLPPDGDPDKAMVFCADLTGTGIYHTRLCNHVAALIATYERTLAEVRADVFALEARFHAIPDNAAEVVRLTAYVASMTVERDGARRLITRAAEHLQVANEIITSECDGDEDDAADEVEFIAELRAFAETPKGETP